MNTHADKGQQNASRAVAHDLSQKQTGAGGGLPFTDIRPEAIQMKELQALANNSEQIKQLRAYQRIANTSARQPSLLQKKSAESVVQCSQKIIQLRDLKPKSINGLTHLVKMTPDGHLFNKEDWLENERDEVKSGDRLMVDMDNVWDSRRGIDQESNWKKDEKGGGLHAWVETVELNSLPVEKSLFVREEMLKDGWEGWADMPKKTHSILVQGGSYGKSAEAQAGISARQGEDLEGWVNMIWLYNSGVSIGAYKEQQGQQANVDVGKLPRLMEKSFAHEMEIWKERGDRPEWVTRWLPILDVLYRKKSFIAMSDLIRMIILYYEGGLYMDIKIKVDPDKAAFKEQPMLQINKVNFYSLENWAIMANAGSQMIQEIMTTALATFPSPGALESYPENYQQTDMEGKPREGKMHVELHESLGVWKAIDKIGRPGYDVGLSLTNPRKLNSWINPYDDRPAADIEREKLEERRREKVKLEKNVEDLEREKRQMETKLSLKGAPQLWERFEITQALIEKLSKMIADIGFEITKLQFKLMDYDDM